jgi:tetratricopeptide (TPR) repeat protein
MMKIGRPLQTYMNKKRVSYYLASSASLITLAVYLPALRNGFVNWDDDAYVIDNLHIRSLNLAFFRWAFSSFHASNWHPITWVSHALDYAVWGLNPLGHHLTNIVFHSLNTFLVVLLCIKLLEMGKERSIPDGASGFLDDQGIMIAAGVTGLLFGLHPVHVESVAWVAERKDLLCGLFFLLSMSAYTNYVRIRGNGSIREKSAASLFFNRSYLLALVFFVLALLSKPMAVSLPVVLLILDWYPFQRIRSLRSFSDAFVEKLPFIVFSLISSVLTIIAQRTEGTMMLTAFVPLWARMLVAAKAVAAYLVKMAAPIGLSPYYPYPKPQEISPFALQYLFAVFFVVGTTMVLLVTAKKRRLWLSAWGYYVVTLMPVIGIIQVGGQAMADRYAYLPSLGPFFILGLVAARGWWKADSLERRALTAKGFTGALAIALVISLSYLTVKQIAIWKNSKDLWSYVIEKEPDRVLIAYNNRGLAFKEKGQFDRALEDFDRAITLNPSEYEAYTNRGVVLKDMGQIDRAIKDLNTAIILNPVLYPAYNNRGLALKKVGWLDQALADFNTAIALNPHHADAYTNRGQVHEEMGQLDRAIEDYTTAITMNPTLYSAYNNRGIAFKETGQLDRALEDFTTAVTLNPAPYIAYMNRGITFKDSGQFDRAIGDYTMALSFAPIFVEAYLERGTLYLETGRRELAVRDFQKACDLGSEAGCEAAR